MAKCGTFVQDNGKNNVWLFVFPYFSFYYIFNVRRYSFCSGVIL